MGWKKDINFNEGGYQLQERKLRKELRQRTTE